MWAESCWQRRSAQNVIENSLVLFFKRGRSSGCINILSNVPNLTIVNTSLQLKTKGQFFFLLSLWGKMQEVTVCDTTPSKTLTRRQTSHPAPRQCTENAAHGFCHQLCAVTSTTNTLCYSERQSCCSVSFFLTFKQMILCLY